MWMWRSWWDCPWRNDISRLVRIGWDTELTRVSSRYLKVHGARTIEGHSKYEGCRVEYELRWHAYGVVKEALGDQARNFNRL